MILATGGATVGPLQKATRSIPIVFVIVTDPVGVGYVNSLARPGGNITGFELFEYSIGGKWLELLKQIAPQVRRVAGRRRCRGQLGAIQSVAPALGVQLSPLGLRGASEIERGITAFARGSDGDLIVTANPEAVLHRDLIISLALLDDLKNITVRDSLAAHTRSGQYKDRNYSGDLCAKGRTF